MDDLINEFITETSESLAVLDLELVKLEKNPNDTTILGNIFRLVHTIKGTCGFLGLPRLESIAHASENVLGKIRDKTIVVSPHAISLVLESLDCIKKIMDFLGANGTEPEGDDKPLIAILNQFADSDGKITAKPGSDESSVAPSEPVSEAVESAEVVAAPQAQQEKQSEPHAATPEPAKEEISPKAKEVAISHGLATEAKAAPAAPVGNDPSTQSIRVSIDVLENLMQMVSELVLTRNQLMQIARTRSDNTFMAPLQQLSHITTELQEGIMKTRMQPIGNAWAKFPRLIRDLSLELNKKIELRMEGAETELDRQLLELIKDPLTHMVRNSADHGIEVPADRMAAGKSETGTITLSAYHEGGHIIIEIFDDGRGLNIERIKQKAVTNGIATLEQMATMSEQQIMQFIFRAGFSTAEKVTSVSGRGVGMDVVRTNIEKIGGTIELSSVYGKGSKFHIKIPLTLAIVSVLIVEAGHERFAIPQINVQELVRSAADSEYKIEEINHAPVLRLRGNLVPLITLSEVLNIKSMPQPHDPVDSFHTDTSEAFIVVCKVGAYTFGVIVDRIFDTEEIVVKPASELLRHIDVYSGNTILGDGSVIMILDPNGLARSTGQKEIAGDQDDHSESKLLNAGDPLVSFLLFKSGNSAPKAVPLELVSRLEEIDSKQVEYSGDHPVIQYRGDLMRLVTLNPHQTEFPEGMHDVIVFSYDNKTLGLVVDEIIDIVETPFAVKLTTKEQGYLGSMVVQGKTTDIVDVAHLLRDMIDVQDHLHMENKQRHMLLVEDSVFFRNLTAPFLTAAGYVVTAVGSGREALKLLFQDKRHFDVVVSDIEMPEMDGFELVQAIHANKLGINIPVFAFTSTINSELLARSREVGFRDFIIKTDRGALLKSIAQAFNEEREHA